MDLQKPLEGVRRSAVAQTGVEFDGSNDETEIIARGLQEKNVHDQKKKLTPIPKQRVQVMDSSDLRNRGSHKLSHHRILLCLKL